MEFEIICCNLEDLKVVDFFHKKYPKIFTRAELCTDLQENGLTCDEQTLKAISLFKTNLKLFALVRRSNNYFYDAKEFALLKKDLELCKKHQVTGVVIGLITKNLEIDQKNLQKLVSLAKPLKITFHKAFDHVSDYLTSISILKGLKIDYCLTVCDPKEKFSVKNLKKLLLLKNIFSNIIVGGGINFKNLESLLKNQFSIIHLGRCVRVKNSFDQPISFQKMEKLALIAKKYLSPSK